MHAFGCKESTTTTGTGNLTIAQVSGYPRISEVGFTHTNGRRFRYSIVDSDHKPIESGIGYLTTDANTLVRAKIKATYISSTYDDLAPTAASLASGTKYVLLTPGAGVYGGNTRIFDDNSRMAVTSGTLAGGDASYAPVGANTLIFSSFLLLHEIECTGLAFKLHTTASANVRFGLFDLADDGRPGKMHFDTGSIDVSTGSNTLKSYALGTNIRLYPGHYLIGTNCSATGWNMLGATAGNYGANFLGYSSTFKVVASYYIGSVTYAALGSDPAGTLTEYLDHNATQPVIYLTCL